MNTSWGGRLFIATISILRAATAAAQTQDSLPGGGMPASTTCTDSQGQVYSAGAIAQMDGELKRCVIGAHWVGFGPASTSSVSSPDTDNPLSAPEAAIMAALRDRSLPTLDCDTVLNSKKTPEQLMQTTTGEQLVINFWTPTCAPCKPVLQALAGLAGAHPKDVAIVGIVQAADPDLDPPGQWELLRVKEILEEQAARFPTCVHRSSETTQRWQAQGVPLVLLIQDNRVSRVALGTDRSLKLIDVLKGGSK